nr:hypothetical protein [Mycobacterium sp. DL592]
MHDLVGTGILDAEDAVRGAAGIGQLAEARDQQAGAYAPEGPPCDEDGEGVTPVERQLQATRDRRKDQGLQ